MFKNSIFFLFLIFFTLHYGSTKKSDKDCKSLGSDVSALALVSSFSFNSEETAQALHWTQKQLQCENDFVNDQPIRLCEKYAVKKATCKNKKYLVFGVEPQWDCQLEMLNSNLTIKRSEVQFEHLVPIENGRLLEQCYRTGSQYLIYSLRFKAKNEFGHQESKFKWWIYVIIFFAAFILISAILVALVLFTDRGALTYQDIKNKFSNR